MTTPRRRWKSLCGRAMAAVAAALAGFGFALAVPRVAATTELIVVDRHTGLAIGGFDPVAYFTEGAPRLGKNECEYGFAGGVWRFRNAGNRAAFIANPEVYAPRFGGHDPLGVVRGVAIAGNPLIWLIVGDRVYLFHGHETRADFAADPALAAIADRRWPDVQRTLSP